MQKNDKFYAFLFSHSYNRSRIYIKRVAIRRANLHLAAGSILVTACLAAVIAGIGSFVSVPDLAEALTANSIFGQVSARSVEDADTSQDLAADRAMNSGGPEANDADGETSDVDAQIEALRDSSRPEFLPTMWAHLGKINNEFGFRRNPFGGRSYEFHPGIDIDGERGDAVIAPANGTIVSAGYKGGYGNMVEIDHGNGLTTYYGHLSKVEAESGEPVTRGQVIGYIGSTGRSTGPHLHFEVRLNDRPINPRHFLPPEPVDLASIRK